MSSDASNRARVLTLRPVAAHPSKTATPPAAPSTVREERPAEPRQPGVEPARDRDPLWRDVVGDVLRRERLAQERTLKDVADAARISMPYLSELERGRKEASSEVLAAAARALGLGLSDLLSLVQGELARSATPASRRPTRLDSTPTASVTRLHPAPRHAPAGTPTLAPRHRGELRGPVDARLAVAA